MVDKLLRDWDSQVAQSFKNIVGSTKPAIGAALAFYMKPGERPNSFEFLHKTFAEYLVARRIVKVVWSNAEDFARSRKEKSGRSKDFDETKVLRDWMRLMGPRPIDYDLLRFLREELSNLYGEAKEDVALLRDSLAKCMQFGLREGLPAHALFQLPDDQLVRRPQSFREAVEQARNAEEALLACLNAAILPELNELTFRPIDFRPDGHDSTSIGSLIVRLRGQRVGGYILALTLFSGIDCSREILHLQDLYNLCAIKADFSKSQLFMAIMWDADVTDANFDGADLWSAVFRSPEQLSSNRLTDDQLERIQFDQELAGGPRSKRRRKK
ncbi:hypothetical protein DNX69_06805 [Rhodopseudomonas palustris]|uniref:Uncharacterized protein n=1 Tax=Rhodopseudomonas palustris TaxID=1076 RepID=A0A323UIV2_RHOPL|nr:hypothetical protein DNX69_06805 [Rhodopseudomonas palustris]